MLPHGHKFPERNVSSDAPLPAPSNPFHRVYDARAADGYTTGAYSHPKLHFQGVGCADTLNDALRLNR